jgi:hypothetical protein
MPAHSSICQRFEKEALEQVDLAALLVGAAMDAGFDPPMTK